MVRSLFSLALLTVLTLGLNSQTYASDMDPSDDYMGSFVNEACPAPITEQEMMIEEELVPATPTIKKPVMIEMEGQETTPEMQQMPLMGSEEMMEEETMEKPATMMPAPSAQTFGDEGKEEAAEDLSLAS